MPDYATMYRKIFNSATDAIAILQKAQQDTEELFISSPDPEIKILDSKQKGNDKPEKE